ncbi:LysR family transcriptional regulator [Streptomyces sp. NPDC059629]|uniref:LysR family transcriptional regulator n=1 Tax=Streptomyces sp. NPDC059629 TaxID=3346889 RepID=UPI003689245E
MGLGAIDLNRLVALEALLEEKNVTHTGSRPSISQSAMSGSLARLRRHFKDDLLVRVGRDYELTALAEQLLPVVQASPHKAEEALSLARRFDPADSEQQFSVVTSDYVMTVLVEPLLRAITQEAPGVRLDVLPLVTGRPESESNLRCHDLTIVPLGFHLPGVSEAVMRDRFVCIVDPGNPRVHREPCIGPALTAVCDDVEHLPSPGHGRARDGPAQRPSRARVVEPFGQPSMRWVVQNDVRSVLVAAWAAALNSAVVETPYQCELA